MVSSWVFRFDCDVLKIITFETLSIFLGIISAFEIAIFLSFFDISLNTYSKSSELYVTAFILLIVLVSYYKFIILPKKTIKIKNQIIPAPSKKMTAKQLFVVLGDNFTLFLTFYIVFSYYLNAPFWETFIVFIVAQSIALATQVPGGIGVFESSFLLIYPHTLQEKGGILASLAVFRTTYYFLPFILAGLFLFFYKMKRPKSPSST